MQLDHDDRVLLLDVIQDAIQGFQDAKDKTIEDATLSDPETLLELTAVNDDQIARLERMYKEVLNDG